MSLDRLQTLDPAEEEVIDEELAVTDDVLVKVFALGPGASIDPHEHDSATNVFHVVEGAVIITQGDSEKRVTAPGVVLNERGQVHGAANESDQTALLTASLCPLPS